MAGLFFGFFEMLLQISNWRIEKAKGGVDNDKIVGVRMVANKLDLDKENQEILPQAFSKATIDNFLEEGIIDWHHQSVMGRTQNERANAIIGKPISFEWEGKLPVVYANLTKGHPIVKDSILPHLEADQPVFGASVGGSVKKAKSVWDSEINGLKDQISEIHWDHLAICGRPYAVSGGTEVSMIKALGAEGILINYSDIGEFERNYFLTERETELRKALEVGAGTDIAQLTGVDALRIQTKKKNEDALIKKLLLALKDNVIGANKNGIKLFLRAEGFTEEESDSKTKKLTEALQKIL